MAADGTIYIETAIDKDGFVAGGKEVEAAARRMAKTVSGIGNGAQIALKKQAESFVRMNQQYSQQTEKVEKLKGKLKELGNAKVETKEYAEIGQQIDKEKEKLEKLLDTQEKFLSTGGKPRSSAYKRRQLEIEELTNSIRFAKTEQDELLNSGKAYAAPDTSKIEETLSTETQKLSSMNRSLGNSYDALKQKVVDYKSKSGGLVSVQKRMQKAVSMVGSAIKSIGSASKKAASTLKTMVSALKKAAEGMFGLGKQSKNATSSISGAIKTLLKYNLGIRSLFVLANRIRNAAKEGMNNLVQYSGSVNANVSSIVSALTRLKNSLATAFAPILSVVAPILTSFINMLSTAASYVGMFFAALTGKNTFTQAKTVQQDYAASLTGTSDASKSVADSANDAAKATKKAGEAAKGSLAAWDELNVIQMDNADAADNLADTTGTTPSITDGITPQDMFEDVPIKKAISDFVKKLKKMIADEDWSGIGKMLGQGINKGLTKLNKFIRWDTNEKKIRKGVDAITGIFNSMVDEIKWRYLGNTAGEGINTIFRTLNLLIDKTHWKKLGRSFAEAVNGLFETVDWPEVGKFFGNKLMVFWDTLYGFFTGLEYDRIGKSIGDGLNGMISAINPKTIGTAIYSAINGAFSMIGNFAETVNWDKLADTISTGINTTVHGIEWSKDGKAFDTLLNNFLDSMLKAAKKTDWEALGTGIGDFLGEIRWREIFTKVFDIIKEILGGLISGLWETDDGKALLGIAGAGLTIKLVGPLLGLISSLQKLKGVLKGSKAITDPLKEVADAAENVGGKSGLASTALGNLASSPFFVGLVGIGGGIAGTVALAYGLNKIVEVAQGGNGILTEAGGAIQSLIQNLATAGELTPDQADSLFKFAEDCETAGMSADDTIQAVMDKMSEFNVSSDGVKRALADLWQQQSISSDMNTKLSKSIEGIGDNSEKLADKLNLSKVAVEDAYEGLETAVKLFGTQAGLTSDQVTSLETTLYKQEDAKASAQDTYDALMQKVEDMGLSTEKASDLIAKVIPEAFKEAGKNSSKTVDEEFSKDNGAGSKIKEKYSGMATNVSAGWNSQIGKEKDKISTKTTGAIEDAVINPVKQMLGIASPSTLFRDFAEYCGLGFSNHLGTAFSSTFQYFRNFGNLVTNSIGDLGYIGNNAVIGINNGMVNAAGTLYANARQIAMNISNIFRTALQIHSPSKVMEMLGSYTMEGFQVGMEDWMGRIAKLAESLSGTIQNALNIDTPSIDVPVTLSPKAAASYPKQIPYLAQGTFVPPNAEKSVTGGSEEINATSLKKILADLLGVSGNQGENVSGMVAALQNALSGMDIIFDDDLVGHLQKKNAEYRNRTGYGMFEGV